MARESTGAVRVRRGFTLVPLACVLWVVLIVLGVALWQKVPPAGYVPAKGVGPGQIGSVILAVLYGGFWVVMVSGIAERKGKPAANLTAVIALGFAAAMLGLSYAGLTKDQRSLAAKAGSGGTQGVAPAITSPGGSVPMATGTASTPEVRGAAPAADTPKPVGPATRGPAARGPATVGLAPTQPGIPESSRPAARMPEGPTAAETRAQEKARTEQLVAKVTSEVAKELNAAIEEILAGADKVIPQMESPIAHDLVKIRKRLEDLGSLRKKAEALEARLKEADGGVQAAMREAGVEPVEAGSATMRWAAGFGVTPRQFACGSLVRMCDKGLEEVGYLKDQFPKWTLTSKGEMRVFEKPLEAKFNSNRFFARTEAERYRDQRGRLESGR